MLSLALVLIASQSPTQAPEAPEAPDVAEAPEAPEAPETPEAGAAPGTEPEAASSTPSAPQTEATVSDPGAGDERPMVLLLDLTASDVSETEKRLLTNDVAFALSQYPELNVVTQDDIKQMIDVEAEKQALGCDTASCLSEIAGAMGAQYIVFGGVIQTDERYQADLNLFDSRAARAVARERVRGAKVEEVSDGMPAAIDRLIGPLGVESRVLARPAGDKETGLPVLLLAGAGVAGVGAAGAIGFGLLVGAAELQLGSSGEAVKAGDRELWTSMGWVGLIGAGVSTVALLAGAGLAATSFAVE